MGFRPIIIKKCTLNFATMDHSSDATLSNRTYQVGDDAKKIQVPSFTSNKINYDVVLAYGTAPDAKIILTATKADANATVNEKTEVALVHGEGTATITVTAENGTKQTYTVRFTTEEPPITPVPEVIWYAINGQRRGGRQRQPHRPCRRI